MTLTDQQVLDIINDLLNYERVCPTDRCRYLRTLRGGAASLPALHPIVTHYLTIADTTVAGRVIDPQGQPIHGAHIQIQNADEEVTTDTEGKFTIKTTVGATLVITTSRRARARANVTLQTCQVEHDHWEGKMACGQLLPCPRHGSP
jgi:Carboxypeptidase regulatory-like domain